jgi:hypothetical protein
MVNAALRAEFQRERVALIELEAGARAFVGEALAAASGPVEVVLGASFGDAEATDAAQRWTLASIHTLSASWPALADHRLGGKSVLPFAVSLAWLTHALRSHHGFGGAVRLEDARVLRGVSVGPEPEVVSAWVGPLADGKVPLELRDARGNAVVRAHGTIVSDVVAAASLSAPADLVAYPHSMRHAYDALLFHGPRLEALASVDGASPSGMVVHLRSDVVPSALVPAAHAAWGVDPLALDGVFQALILWCREHRGAPSLPSRIGALTVVRASEPGAVVRAVVRVREADGAIVTSDVELRDAHGVVARVEGYACTVSASLDRAFAPEPASAPALA